MTYAPSGALLFLALLLAGCGGGGGGNNSAPVAPAPPAVQTPAGPETVREYWRNFGEFFRGVLVRQSDHAVYAEWTVRYGVADWGDTGSREVARIETCTDGKEYVVLYSFDDTKLGNSYPITDFRTEIQRDGGAWIDITNVCGTKGVVYMPVAVPASGSLRLRQWAHVHGNREGTPDYAVLKPFYWESYWTYGGYEYNPCWAKGAESRKVVVQQELWWDAGDFGNPAGQWARGRGSAVPWQNGRPVDIGASSFIHRITIAKDAGVGWTADEPNKDLTAITKLCLRESEWRE